MAVARALGRSPAQVALNWITRRPGVAYIFFQPEMRGMINGGTTVRTEPPWYRG
jgi:aryl-alcohol dehydrogenase-like predicted oxidoreductase